ncbi:D-alanyl-D-alanine carboxypeptidase [Sporosarcina sp. BP05]|uniref:D-alanyl-D-alanine carboxypeptidase n=1 Tax=Sporosarcina sp. BP05 TaxID=2758726 RepID=UPI001644916F|nr:D-alanyl-D-alanine carboxypeptidase [Sporosarcina sp. BP05]
MQAASSSVTVRKASTGEVVYQKQGHKGITPASTLKILKAAAALKTLGENYHFKTDVLTNGKVTDSCSRPYCNCYNKFNNKIKMEKRIRFI